MRPTGHIQRSTLASAVGSAALLLLATLAGMGCADDPGGYVPAPPAPTTDFDTAFVAARSASAQPATFTEYESEQSMPAGETSTLKISEDMSLVVGDGALSETVEMTAKAKVKTVAGSTSYIAFEFGPEMTFKQSIELRIDFDLIDGLQYRHGAFILWYKGSFGWVFSDEGEVQGDDVVFEVDHFSKYAVGD